MPSFLCIVTTLVGWAAVAVALPAQPLLTAVQRDLYAHSKRQNAAAAAAGLSDVDILQFALTLEWLETSFYQQGLALFSAADFAALGLGAQDVADLAAVGASEATHVTLLQSAIAQSGVQPVQPCTYAFNLTTAAAMLATAAVLENVGVAAYLGAAPLVASASLLGTAAAILTVEARHQTFVRVATAALASPGALDTALSPLQVFSLAAPFIQSCPTGSNLALTAFPALTMAAGAAAVTTPGATLAVTSAAETAAAFCAFTNGNFLTGTAFTAFVPGTGCTIPGLDEIAGIVYVNLVSQTPATGTISDDIIVAGPMVLQIS